MCFDVITNGLTSITDFASESCLNPTLLGRECDSELIFIETSLAVSHKKVFLYSILNDFRISIQIASYFRKEDFVELLLFDGQIWNELIFRQLNSKSQSSVCFRNTNLSCEWYFLFLQIHSISIGFHRRTFCKNVEFFFYLKKEGQKGPLNLIIY